MNANCSVSTENFVNPTGGQLSAVVEASIFGMIGRVMSIGHNPFADNQFPTEIFGADSDSSLEISDKKFNNQKDFSSTKVKTLKQFCELEKEAKFL